METDEKILKFEFDKHIKRMDYSHAKEQIQKKLQKKYFFKSKKKKLEQKLKRINSLQDKTDYYYSYLMKFFNKIKSQHLCYSFYRELEFDGCRKFYVEIKKEIGFIQFEIDDSESLQGFQKDVTYIPIKEGSNEATLTLYKKPSIKIPSHGKINLYYQLHTEFELGRKIDENHLDFTEDYLENFVIDNKIPFLSTHNLKKVIGPLALLFASKRHLYFGKPGQMHLRFKDAIFEEFRKSIFGNKTEYGRENFELSADIYIDGCNKPFYQGKIECDGNFPFYINKDDGGDERHEKYIPSSVDELILA